MIRDSSQKASREMLSVRIPTPLYDRLRVYIASNRLNIQDFVEEVLTGKLDEVDPVGKSRQQALERAAAASQPRSEQARLDALESGMVEIKELLQAAVGHAGHGSSKGRKRA